MRFEAQRIAMDEILKRLFQIIFTGMHDSLNGIDQSFSLVSIFNAFPSFIGKWELESLRP